MNRYLTIRGSTPAVLAGAALLFAPLGYSQTDDDEDVFELSPFTVEGSDDQGYRATSTLAGTRIRTDLRDVGSAISVYTQEFLQDTNATSNESLLMYTTSTEVGGPGGNFAGVGSGPTPTENFTTPNTNTRVRGLAAADNTRGYFLSDVPWDGYNTNRIDMQRGPNSILFGLGSPAGIINATLDDPTFSNDGDFSLGFGSWGSTRMSFKANRVLIEDELAIRIAGLRDDEKFRQDPAYEEDERLYVALRYEPGFLNSDAMTTRLSGSIEAGSIESNRPRNLPPMDRITPFFRPVGSQTTYDDNGVPTNVTFPLYGGLGGRLYNPVGVEDQSGDYGLGENRATVQWPIPGDPDGATNLQPNPNYVPMLGNYSQVFASPLMVFPDHNSGAVSGTMVHEIKSFLGIGQPAVGIYAPYQRLGSVDTYQTYATQANLPLANTGTYKNIYLQDRTVFDFYNHLIDGPNKREWQSFDALNLNLSQTFLGGDLGYEIAYYKQGYDRGNVSLLSNGGNIGLFIDTNETLGDGTPNPNAGRPFISDSLSGGNNETFIDREAYRATIYGEYDFQKRGSDNMFTRIMGKHRFTGLHVQDNREQESRNFARYAITNPEFAALQLNGGFPASDIDSNEFMLNTTHYLGGSLLGRSSASGAYIPGIKSVHAPQEGMVRLFDHRWNAPASVDPNALWIDPVGEEAIQAQNPANYVGWTQVPLNLVSWDQSPTARQDYDMYRSGSLAKQEVESQALVWQGFFWDGGLVGTYGWREDKDSSWTYNGVTLNDQAPEASNPNRVTQVWDINHPTYNLNGDPQRESGQTRSWSVAGHLNSFIDEWLPFNVSLYYNESENFQPGAGRVDVYGNQTPSPRGKTRDKSLLVATKDGRYSLKITDYKTSLTNAGSPYLDGTWYVGNLVTWGTTWANIAEYDLTGNTLDTRASQADIDEVNASISPDGNSGQVERWAYANPNLEASAIAAWREFTAAIPQEWLNAWGINGDLQNDVINFGTNQGPSGLTYTEDTVSEGTEFEFMAQPTDNWRISLNASKTKATRNNVGGAPFKGWVDFIDSWIQDTDAGEIRVWWGSGERVVDQWNNNFRSNFSLLELLEGSSNPEIREWNFSVVTNYSFSDGVLSGFNVGGSYRWQDDIVIGYPIIDNGDGTYTFDLDNAYRGPTEDYVDLWLGYGKSLSDSVDWRIQLNVRDVFASKDLIPIATQPNGDWSSVRIPSSTTWQLTNTFSF